ncbi:MAG: serine/threonine protein phosphatase [Spirochaetae bacterium HGW-Spirochaetae-5]|nr:MAG: serine/threonine protein phosphatase [Spirochaetae bacterium HGW-Spirochaetae-5]
MSDRYFLVGDIHGHLSKLIKIITLVKKDFKSGDSFIFLGDYIDRGPSSFEVIEFLIELSGKYDIIFLTGNHEDMFLRYLIRGENYSTYIRNGGAYTIKSYTENLNDFIIPESHKIFFNNLKLYYESDDFIAVHAGLNPGIKNICDQKKNDMIWIREEFYKYPKKWDKTVIFGHTPTPYIHNSDSVYFDESRNIIGLDTNAMSDGYPLSCIRWPDRKVYQAY